MNNIKSRIQSQLLEMLKTQSLYTIKVRALVDSLHIGRSTFYLYYDSVYSVLQDIEDSFFRDLDAITSPFWQYPLEQKYLSEPHPVLLKALEFLDAHRELSLVLWGPYGDLMYQARCKKMLQKNIFPEHIAKALYPENTWLIVSYKVGGHLEALRYWRSKETDISINEMTVKSYQMLFGDVL